MTEAVTMSVAKALAELKLLEKRIQDKTEKMTIIVGVKADKKTVGEEAMKEMGSQLQSLKDMMKRRLTIKRAIIESNSKTEVVVGGKTMTVAEAIERKQSIELDKALEKRLRENYYISKNNLEKHNNKVYSEAAAAAERVITSQNLKATDGKDIDPEDPIYKSIYNGFVAVHELIGVEVEGAEKIIETMGREIEDFYLEVDNALVESNVKTTITIQ